MSSPVQKTRIALALACISIIAFIAWKLPATPADKAEATATAAAEAPPAGAPLQRDAPATPVAATTCGAGPCDHPEHSQTVAIQAPRKMDLPADFLERITTGDKVALQLPDGRKISCEEPRIERDEKGVVMVQGTFTEPAKGSFFFRRQDFPGVAGKMVGHVIFDGQETAWKVLPEGKNGDPILKEVPIGEVVCVKFMPTPEDPQEMPQDHPSTRADAGIPGGHPAPEPARRAGGDLSRFRRLEGPVRQLVLQGRCRALGFQQLDHPRHLDPRGGGFPALQHQRHHRCQGA